MTLVLTDVSKNAVVNALTASIDAGVSAGNIKFRTGTPPASASAGEAAGVIVATFNFPDKPSFNPGGTSPNPAGTAALNATGVPFSITNNGPPTYFRIYRSTGVVMLQGIVNTDINVTGAAWQSGGSASISSFLINTSAPPPATVVNSGPITVTITLGVTATASASGGGSETLVNSGDNLQTAINNAASGAILSLQAGATFTGNFTVPTGKTNLTIKSQNLGSLSAGVRVSEASAANMPKIVSPTGSPPTPAIVINPGTTGVKLQGLEVTTAHTGETVNQNGLIRVGWDTTNLGNLVGTAASGVEIDRCYVHGLVNVAVNSGIINYNANGTKIIHCHVDEIHGGTSSESTGIHIQYSPGPAETLIENCFVEAASINVFVGDGGSAAAYGGPQNFNVTMRGCWLYKPFKWYPAHATYSAAEASVFQATVKNHFECKCGSNILVEGNLFTNAWESAQALSISLKSIRNNIDGVTIQNNVFKNCRTLMLCSANSLTGLEAATMNDITWNNNLAYTDYAFALSNQHFIRLAAQPGKLTNVDISHNTTIRTSSGHGAWLLYDTSSANAIVGFTCKNNIHTAGSECVRQEGGGRGSVATAQVCDAFDFNTNVYVNSFTFADHLADTTGWVNYDQVTTHAGIGFTDTNFNDIADFELSTGSTYNNGGTDGQDVGVDVATLLAALNDDANF